MFKIELLICFDAQYFELFLNAKTRFSPWDLKSKSFDAQYFELFLNSDNKYAMDLPDLRFDAQYFELFLNVV